MFSASLGNLSVIHDMTVLHQFIEIRHILKRQRNSLAVCVLDIVLRLGKDDKFSVKPLLFHKLEGDGIRQSAVQIPGPVDLDRS